MDISDLSCVTSDQLLEVAKGKNAAKNGEPFDPHQSQWWRCGWALWPEAAEARAQAAAQLQ